MEVREVPTAEDLLAGVKEDVAEIVRAALEEAATLRSEADECLERYDATTGELTRLRLELHALTHDLQDLPDRITRARLDSLVYGVGEDPDSLQARYIQVRERAPVVEARIGRLENELSSLVAGGSRPAQVRNERHLLKHKGREPALDVLNDAAKSVEALRKAIPDVVTKAAEDLLSERKRVRDGQTQLWGQAKAQR
jgi:uncharacterized protein YoxC